MKKEEEINEWHADKYKKHAGFVTRMALPVIDLLAPKPGERILDLGCGEGTPALEIEKSGAKVVAVDLSDDMVQKARQKGLDARVANATDLPFEAEFDAVFSNATLHWVPQSRLALQNIAKALKKGGRFVAEFGGEGNVKAIREAIQTVFARHPEFGKLEIPWYFPSTEAYGALLKEEGFRVEYIERIPKPTAIDDIANWLMLFTNGLTAHLTQEQETQFRHEARELLKASLYTEEKGWTADYVRIRVKAVKV